MINLIKDITKDNINQLFEYLVESKGNANEILKLLGKVDQDNGFGSIFIKPATNKLFSLIILNKKHNAIQSVVFYGCFNISFVDLKMLFSFKNEHYSPYDNHYEYLFDGIGEGSKLLVFSKDTKILDQNRIYNIEFIL
jgi:hypothetical protein